MRSNIKNITGQRFGRLIALKATSDRKRHQVVWEFKCDCGNSFFQTGSNVRRGFTSSCGCLLQEYNKSRTRNLVGNKIGRLTVLSLSPIQMYGGTAWICKCDCGKTKTFSAGHLNRHRVLSCGCLHKEITMSMYKDIRGQRFGKLIAVKPTKMRRKGVVWECLCDCGNTCFVGGSVLRNTTTRSCGCLAKAARLTRNSHINPMDIPIELVEANELRIKIEKELKKTG